MSTLSNQTHISELERIFKKEGVRNSLIYLNSLTELRFTCFLQIHDETLRTLTFYDRKNPTALISKDIPVTESYCVFVRDTGLAFSTKEAKSDFRLNGHPKQNILQSYCGIPVLENSGKLFGTLCHYDEEPKTLSRPEIQLLEHLAGLLKVDMTTRKAMEKAALEDEYKKNVSNLKKS